MLLKPPPTCVSLRVSDGRCGETADVAWRVNIDDLDGVGVADESSRFGIDGAVDDVLVEDCDDACMVCHI